MHVTIVLFTLTLWLVTTYLILVEGWIATSALILVAGAAFTLIVGVLLVSLLVLKPEHRAEFLNVVITTFKGDMADALRWFHLKR